MPNWNRIVRQHLAVLRLPPEREIEIVEELALHLEAAYEDALADGLSEMEAKARAVRSKEDCEWNHSYKSGSQTERDHDPRRAGRRMTIIDRVRECAARSVARLKGPLPRDPSFDG